LTKKIIITFDYETYLGDDSGTIERCMIDPTNEILKILKKNGARAIFFVDATFLSVIKRDCYSGYVKIKKQIVDILKNGHNIGLHIHPQWIDSYKIGDCKWSFSSYENYRLHNLPIDKIHSLINKSYKELSKVCSKYSCDYKIDAFRAGGWCVQPFSTIQKHLKEVGIKYDFSVLPELKKNNLPKHFYDYKSSPKMPFWRFDIDVLVVDVNGHFIELPTSIITMNILDILKVRSVVSKSKIMGDGKGADIPNNYILDKIKKISLLKKYPLSSDYMTLDCFKKNIKTVSNEIAVYVAHPKNFSEESFLILDYLTIEFDSLVYKDIK
jgi:hypothetical protein